MELSGSNIKKFLTFSLKKDFTFQERNFLIFQDTETLKNFLYFRE